ncbi:Extracellular serine proteinase [Auxenochlorella protothecoides]|uniref:Extracellular serine proteinase n=1 Tax=Auxenochlorella protothecoides TaxID=3075 RepID=A0A087SRE4_AUXPR|nr:Extracellular serine proteinase [Auxenochlorella protothecoides]KFM28298.1 Extracellular serine proteinase [Auxenochlorella protothecoides]
MLDQEDQESLRSSHGSDIQSMEDNTQLHTAELVSKSSEMTLLSYSPPRLSTRGSLWTQDGPAWPLQRINRRRWSPGMSPPADYAFSALGSGVNAYIVDTGIRLSHREFASFPDGTGASRALPAMSVFGDDDANDCNGHGTHNAALLGGLTFGVAKNTTLWSVRAVDCDGTTSVVALLQASGGLDWVARNAQRPAVVNLSLRSTTGSSALADAATRLVTEFQLPVVVAAGNEGSQACGSSPGNATGVLTVGASTMQNAAWNLTNW